MAFERSTSLTDFDIAGGHERLGAMMDALPAHPLAHVVAAQSPPEGGPLVILRNRLTKSPKMLLVS